MFLVIVMVLEILCVEHVIIRLELKNLKQRKYVRCVEKVCIHMILMRKESYMYFNRDTVVIVLLCTICLVNAMENNLMVEIKSENDIVPFVKNVVAYTTDSYALGKGGGYVLRDPIIKYGYIEDKGHGNRQMQDIYDKVVSVDVYGFGVLDKYYQLHQLLKFHGDMPNAARYLDDGVLKYALLTVRNINQQEAQEILNAVEHKKAKFDSLNAEFNLFATILKSLQDKI